jgi:hypothetical protein
MRQHMTMIQIELDGKEVAAIRDINVPATGDVISLFNKKVVEVKRRHWIIDKEMSDRPREFRCILECE